MIKPSVKVRLKFIFASLLVFLAGFIAGINLAVLLLLLVFYAYLKSRRLNIRSATLLNLTLLFLINLAVVCFVIRQGYPVFYIPFSVVPMLAVLLFGSLEIAFILTLVCAIASASLASDPFQALLLYLTSGIFSSMLVFGARKRTTIIRAGLIAGAIQVCALAFLDNFWIAEPARYFALLLNGLACGIIVLGVLPVFEYLFKTVTNISLLEMADFNQPLLARLVSEAPGTYHHSLVVGNLSEAACKAVGANALLARIGAYYHDIGKLEKAEYFTENQDIPASKHDALAPSMSKLIIMNHVKEGVQLAKKYKLSPALTDFILQHHGNSLVYYFYRRALENLEDDRDVKEEGFRYPGPKPETKETAIVLLADSVEAASRALKDQSPAKIEEVVHKIINNKFIDGQLDACDLALKDLEKISAVFIRILGAIYRNRVSYPETKSENNRKKSAKEGPDLSGKDKEGSS